MKRKNLNRSSSLGRGIAIFLTTIMVLLSVPMVAMADNSSDTGQHRISGDNRYLTAWSVAAYLHHINGDFDNVVVAYGGNFPDALSGGYLTKVKNAPLLLINPKEEKNTIMHIQEIMKPSGTIYLLGGTGVISSEFESTLKTKGMKVKRLWGQGRYDTNLEILKEAVKPGDEILVATGTNYADSLSGSSVGKGMLLVGKGLTTKQIQWIKNAGIKKFYILGGTGAVSVGIENELKKFGQVERIGGKNRYETSYLIAKKFFPTSKHITLVSGKNFPDGLSGAPYAMSKNAPILLVSDGSTDFAKKYFTENKVTGSTTIGGPGAVPHNVEGKVWGQDVYEGTPTTTERYFTFMGYYIDKDEHTGHENPGRFAVILRNDTGSVLHGSFRCSNLGLMNDGKELLPMKNGEPLLSLVPIQKGQCFMLTTSGESLTGAKYYGFKPGETPEVEFMAAGPDAFFEIRNVPEPVSINQKITTMPTSITKASVNYIDSGSTSGIKPGDLKVLRMIAADTVNSSNEKCNQTIVSIENLSSSSIELCNNGLVSYVIGIWLDEKGTILGSNSIYVSDAVAKAEGYERIALTKKGTYKDDNNEKAYILDEANFVSLKTDYYIRDAKYFTVVGIYNVGGGWSLNEIPKAVKLTNTTLRPPMV